MMLWWSALAQAAEWRLAAAYDSSAVALQGGRTSSYVWQAAPGMEDSCGRAKGPDGLGIFEAEAAGARLSPTLVLLLERTEGEGGLTHEDLRVAVTDGERRVLLQPMVEPRHLAVIFDVPTELSRYAQLVRTQLEVETCLEHKTGRGWTGSDVSRVRQALLLEEPLLKERSRKFFGGQLDPVPALLGPPDACIVGVPSEREERPEDASLWLVPTDVWGASLRTCGTRAGDPVPAPNAASSQGAPERDPPTGHESASVSSLPLALTHEPPIPRRPTWTELHVTLTLAPGEGTEEERVRLTMTYGPPGAGRTLVEDLPLYEKTPSGLGLRDLLAHVPHAYPLIGGRYVPLLIPEWQIVEALRRLDRPETDPNTPLSTPPAGVVDGVGRLLAEPSLLSVQVRPEQGEAWPNLAGVLQTKPIGQPIGYTVGLVAARSPIVLPGATPGWQDNARGQRAFEFSLLMAALCVVVVGASAGLYRVRDLWTRVPHERAHYWPGLGRLVLIESRDNVDSPIAEEEA